MTLNETRLNVRRLTDEFVVRLCKMFCAETNDPEYMYEDDFNIRFGSPPDGHFVDRDPGHAFVWIEFAGNYKELNRPALRSLVARVRGQVSEFVNDVTQKHDGIIKSLEVKLHGLQENKINAAFSIALNVPDKKNGV